jgi:hypothetical protein
MFQKTKGKKTVAEINTKAVFSCLSHYFAKLNNFVFLAKYIGGTLISLNI